MYKNLDSLDPLVGSTYEWWGEDLGSVKMRKIIIIINRPAKKIVIISLEKRKTKNQGHMPHPFL